MAERETVLANKENVQPRFYSVPTRRLPLLGRPESAEKEIADATSRDREKSRIPVLSTHINGGDRPGKISEEDSNADLSLGRTSGPRWPPVQLKPVRGSTPAPASALAPLPPPLPPPLANTDRTARTGQTHYYPNIRVVKTREHRRPPIAAIASSRPAEGKLFQADGEVTVSRSSSVYSLGTCPGPGPELHAAVLKLTSLGETARHRRKSGLGRSEVESEREEREHGSGTIGLRWTNGAGKGRRRTLSRLIEGLQAKGKALMTRPGSPRPIPPDEGEGEGGEKGEEEGQRRSTFDATASRETTVRKRAGRRMVSRSTPEFETRTSLGATTALCGHTSEESDRFSLSSSSTVSDASTVQPLSKTQLETPEKRRVSEDDREESMSECLPVRVQASVVPEIGEVDCTAEKAVWAEIEIGAIVGKGVGGRRGSGRTEVDVVVIVDNSSQASLRWISAITKLTSELAEQSLEQPGDRLAVVSTDCGAGSHPGCSMIERCIVCHLASARTIPHLSVRSFTRATCQEGGRPCSHFERALQLIVQQKEEYKFAAGNVNQLQVVVFSPTPERVLYLARLMDPFVIHCVTPAGEVVSEFAEDACVDFKRQGESARLAGMSVQVYDDDWVRAVAGRMAAVVESCRGQEQAGAAQICQVSVQAKAGEGCILERVVGNTWMPSFHLGQRASVFACVRVLPLRRRTRKRSRAKEPSRPQQQQGQQQGQQQPSKQQQQQQQQQLELPAQTGANPDIDEMEYDIKWLLGEHVTVLVSVQVHYLCREGGRDSWRSATAECLLRRPNASSMWSSPIFPSLSSAKRPGPGRHTHADASRRSSFGVLERLGYHLAETENFCWTDVIESVNEIQTGRVPDESLSRMKRFFLAAEMQETMRRGVKSRLGQRKHPSGRDYWSAGREDKELYQRHSSLLPVMSGPGSDSSPGPVRREEVLHRNSTGHLLDRSSGPATGRVYSWLRQSDVFSSARERDGEKRATFGCAPFLLTGSPLGGSRRSGAAGTSGGAGRAEQAVLVKEGVQNCMNLPQPLKMVPRYGSPLAGRLGPSHAVGVPLRTKEPSRQQPQYSSASMSMPWIGFRQFRAGVR